MWAIIGKLLTFAFFLMCGGAVWAGHRNLSSSLAPTTVARAQGALLQAAALSVAVGPGHQQQVQRQRIREVSRRSRARLPSWYRRSQAAQRLGNADAVAAVRPAGQDLRHARVRERSGAPPAQRTVRQQTRQQQVQRVMRSAAVSRSEAGVVPGGVRLGAKARGAERRRLVQQAWEQAVSEESGQSCRDDDSSSLDVATAEPNSTLGSGAVAGSVATAGTTRVGETGSTGEPSRGYMPSLTSNKTEKLSSDTVSVPPTKEKKEQALPSTALPSRGARSLPQSETTEPPSNMGGQSSQMESSGCQALFPPGYPEYIQEVEKFRGQIDANRTGYYQVCPVAGNSSSCAPLVVNDADQLPLWTGEFSGSLAGQLILNFTQSSPGDLALLGGVKGAKIYLSIEPPSMLVKDGGNLMLFKGNVTGDSCVDLAIISSTLNVKNGNLVQFGGSLHNSTVRVQLDHANLIAENGNLALFGGSLHNSTVGLLQLAHGYLAAENGNLSLFDGSLHNSTVGLLQLAHGYLTAANGNLSLFGGSLHNSNVRSLVLSRVYLKTENGNLDLFDGGLHNSTVRLMHLADDTNLKAENGSLALFGGSLHNSTVGKLQLPRVNLTAENGSQALFGGSLHNSTVGLLYLGHAHLKVEKGRLALFGGSLHNSTVGWLYLGHANLTAENGSLTLFDDGLKEGSSVDLDIDRSCLRAGGDLALFGGKKNEGVVSSHADLNITESNLTADQSVRLFRDPVQAGNLSLSLRGARLEAMEGPLELIGELADKGGNGSNKSEGTHLELNIRDSALSSHGGRAALVGMLSGGNNSLHLTMSDTTLTASSTAEGAYSARGADAGVVAETTGSDNVLELHRCHNNSVKAEVASGQRAMASLGWGLMKPAGEAGGRPPQDCPNNALRQMHCHSNSLAAEVGTGVKDPGSEGKGEAYASLGGSFQPGVCHELTQWDLYNNTVNATVNATGVAGANSVAGLSLASLGLIHTNTNGSEPSAPGKVEIRQIDSRNNAVEARVDTAGHKHQDQNKKEVASLALATDDPVCRYRCITRSECPCSSSSSSECHPFAEEGIASVLWRQCLASAGGAGEGAGEDCRVSNATVEQYLFEDNKLSNSDDVLVIGSKSVAGRTDKDEAGVCPVDSALSGMSGALHRAFYNQYCKASSIQPGEKVVFRIIVKFGEKTNITRTTSVSGLESSDKASEHSGQDLCSDPEFGPYPNLVCLSPGEVFHSLAPMEKGWLLVTIPPLSRRDGAAGPGLFRLLSLSRPRVSHHWPLIHPDKKVGRLYVDRDGVEGENAEGLQALMAANGTLFHVWSRESGDGSQKLHWRRFAGDDEVHKGSCRLAGDKLLLVSEEDDGVSVWIRGADAMVERRLLETVDTPGQRFEPGGTQGPVVALARHGDWLYSLHDTTDEHWQLQRWNFETHERDPAWSKELGKSPVSSDGADPECLFLSEHTSAGASSRVLPNAMGAGNLESPPPLPREAEGDEWDFILRNGSVGFEVELVNSSCSCHATSGWSLGAAMDPDPGSCASLPDFCMNASLPRIGCAVECDLDHKLATAPWKNATDPRRNVEALPSLVESWPRLIVSDCRVYLVPHGSLPYKHSDGAGSAALAPLLPRAGGCLEWCQRPLRFADIPGCTALPIPEKSSDSGAAASVLLLPAAGAALAVGGCLYKYRAKYKDRCRAIVREPEGQSGQGYPGSGECVPLDDLSSRDTSRVPRVDRHTSERYSACPYVEPDGEEQRLAADARAALHPDREAPLADQLARLAIREETGNADICVLADKASLDTGFLGVADGARRSHSGDSGGSSSGARTPRLICAGDGARRSHSGDGGGSSSGALRPRLICAADGARRSHSGNSGESFSGAPRPRLVSAADGARRSHSGGSSSGVRTPRLAADD